MILYAITTKIFINTAKNIFKKEKKIYSYKLLEEKSTIVDFASNSSNWVEFTPIGTIVWLISDSPNYNTSSAQN